MTALEPPPAISVVITTHQRLERLPALLDRLLADPRTAEVVVAADGCSDGTDDYLLVRAREEPRLRALLLHPNVGQARARAAAVTESTCDVVLSLDDDVMPSEGLISGHAARHARGDVDLVLGYMPTLVPQPRRRGQYATVEYAENYDRAVQRWEASAESVLPTLWAGHLSFRRATYLTAIEGCDYRLHYHEDTELGLRMRTVGCRAVFDRSLRADHRHERGWDSFLREGRSAGTACVLLAQAWPDDLPYDADELLVQASRPVQVLARLCRWELAHRGVLVALRLVVQTGGAVRWWSIEDTASRLAKFLELQRAVRRTRRGLSVA